MERKLTVNPGTPTGPLAHAVRFHAHADEDALVQAVCRQVLLAVALDRRAYADTLLLLSGGSTPVPVYRALAAGLAAQGPDAARLTVCLLYTSPSPRD